MARYVEQVTCGKHRKLGKVFASGRCLQHEINKLDKIYDRSVDSAPIYQITQKPIKIIIKHTNKD